MLCYDFQSEKKKNFELRLFAQSFHEMIMRDCIYLMYQSLSKGEGEGEQSYEIPVEDMSRRENYWEGNPWEKWGSTLSNQANETDDSKDDSVVESLFNNHVDTT